MIFLYHCFHNDIQIDDMEERIIEIIDFFFIFLDFFLSISYHLFVNHHIHYNIQIASLHIQSIYTPIHTSTHCLPNTTHCHHHNHPTHHAHLCPPMNTNQGRQLIRLGSIKYELNSTIDMSLGRLIKKNGFGSPLASLVAWYEPSKGWVLQGDVNFIYLF